MRLGAYPCKIRPNTIMATAYGEEMISEAVTATVTSSTTISARRLKIRACRSRAPRRPASFVETVEIPNHPFYIGVQFHPEFKSRPNRAHPLFKAFVAASLKRSQNNNAD